MRPDHEEFLGSYVRAIHDFQTGHSGEISLTKGDVFQVTEVVDKNWLHGKGVGKEGNFPYDFVEKIKIPIVEHGQKVFAAVEKFTAGQDGDLPLQKGDVLIGLYEIDEYWWQGRSEATHAEGMFPTTHVMELELPKKLRMRSKSVHSAEPLFAQALVDSKAQLDEELSFQAGDIITVTEVVDEDWYTGECHRKKGMFLASCVQLLNEEECNDKSYYEQTRNEVNETQNSRQKCELSERVITSDTKPVIHPIGPNDISEDSGNETDHSKAIATAYTSENTKSHNEADAGVTPYARTLYPFTGELADELSFEAHDIITLIQHVDEQWIEGEIDGKIGVFPSNYVEIVVDCPYAYEQTENLQADSTPSDQTTAKADAGNSHVTNSISQRAEQEEVKSEVEHDDEHYALVLYSFKAETDGDLDITEGETVTVLKKIDDGWLLVKNDSGETGMCPVSFVDVIGSLPDLSSKTHDKNKNEVQKPSAEIIKTTNDIHNTKTDSIVHIKDHLAHDRPSSESPNEIKSKIGVSQNNSKTRTVSKPELKPKPAIAPKPALKPKPVLAPKPFSQSLGFKPVSFDNDMPKSSSSVTLSTMDKTEDKSSSELTGSMTKAQSMVEISKTDNETTPSPSLVNSRENHGGSTSSVTLESENRNSSEIKAFKDWDMTKPLDSLLKDEFNKAKVEAEVKNKRLLEPRSSSFSSPDQSDTRASSVAANKTSIPQYSSAYTRPTSVTPNYSREDFDDFVKVGNSSFYVQDSNKSAQQALSRKLLTKAYSTTTPEFERRPSLKKPAPPRPVGPRVPPMPSKTPIVPVRTVSRPVPSTPQSSTGAGSGRRQHARPAPPRPQPVRRTTPPKGDDLMSFSSTNIEGNLPDVEEPDSDTVVELRSRITDMENDLKNFEKSKGELQQMQTTIGSDETGEIHDNIQFYDDNINGIAAELNKLKANLAQISPKDMDTLTRERAAELKRIEEEKTREEIKKKLEEEKKERRTKRVRVIEELIETEQSFITSMNLIIEIFLDPTTPKHPDVDLEQLFGNIEEVAEVSQKLLNVLEEATQGKDFEEQVIGTCFTLMAEDMKNVYAPYCRNHDHVIILIEKYEQNPDTKAFLDGLLDKLREKHVVFDLEALLIKPVQRVLKYPLLLSALIKATEDDHADKQATLMAVNAMTDVAQAINEYKRRKDLVFKYKKDTDASLRDKLSMLNLHSLKKKSSRIRERFSANLGFIEQTRDANFDNAETRFRQLEKTVKVFVKNVQSYMEELKDIVSCQESIAADVEDYYGEKRDMAAVQKYQTFHSTIRMTFLPNLKMEVDELVIMPLMQVIQMFEGPSKVIGKRYDKLLDYDNMKRKAQSDRVSEKEVQAAKVDYDAMNAQLLEELPRFSDLTFKLLRDCVGSFVRAQREFTDKITHDMYDELDLNFLHDAGIMDTFNIQHSSIVDKLAMLSFMPKTFSPRVADQKQDKKTKRMSLDPSMLKSMEAVPQIDSQRVYVVSHYPQKAFSVTQTHVALDSLDLSVCEGDVVGMVIDKDPMGNKERWFVDNGAKKGFVPRHILTPFQGSPPRVAVVTGQTLQPMPVESGGSSPQSPHKQSPAGSLSVSYNSASNSAILHSLQEEDDMDFALEEDMTPSMPEDGAYDTYDTGQAPPGGQDDDLEFYYAEFAFSGRNSNEVTMFEHQVVTVVTKHDQEGNKEWWYVDADGNRGYAPAAYLKKMDSH